MLTSQSGTETPRLGYVPRELTAHEHFVHDAWNAEPRDMAGVHNAVDDWMIDTVDRGNYLRTNELRRFYLRATATVKKGAKRKHSAIGVTTELRALLKRYGLEP